VSTKTGQGGRPRKGSLEFRGKTWHARLTVTVEGESIRKWFDLGTDNKSVARRKRDRLVAEQAANVAVLPVAAAKAPETVDDFAKGWIQGRRARGIVSAEYEAGFYARVWSPVMS
jgi:hypothetical protein